MSEKTPDFLDPSVKERLLDYWSNSAQQWSGGRKIASRKSIGQFESKHAVRLPNDFRDFLEHVGGFDQQEHYQDARGFNFWPLLKLVRVSEHDGPGHRFADADAYFLFCDYLDFSWAYAIRLAGGGNDVILVGTSDGKPKTVARSFSAFIKEYLADSKKIYP